MRCTRTTVGRPTTYVISRSDCRRYDTVNGKVTVTLPLAIVLFSIHYALVHLSRLFISGITVVLTMTFIGLDNRVDIPRVPYATALDHFLAVCFILISAVIVESAAVNYFTK